MLEQKSKYANRKNNSCNVNMDNYHYYLMARVLNLIVLQTGLGRSKYLLFRCTSDPEEELDACSSCGLDVDVVFFLHT
jgi:hypothetical protein